MRACASLCVLLRVGEGIRESRPLLFFALLEYWHNIDLLPYFRYHSGVKRVPNEARYSPCVLHRHRSSEHTHFRLAILFNDCVFQKHYISFAPPLLKGQDPPITYLEHISMIKNNDSSFDDVL